jgi:hypothetical protein
MTPTQDTTSRNTFFCCFMADASLVAVDFLVSNLVFRGLWFEPRFGEFASISTNFSVFLPRLLRAHIFVKNYFHTRNGRGVIFKILQPNPPLQPACTNKTDKPVFLAYHSRNLHSLFIRNFSPYLGNLLNA